MRKSHTLLFGFLVVFSAGAWFLTWKFYQYAKRLESANAVYLQERNNIIEKLTSVYGTVLQVEAILEKLGISAQMIQDQFAPLLEKGMVKKTSSLTTDERMRESIASLLLIEYTPLDAGIHLLGEMLPVVERKIGEVLQRGRVFEEYYEKLKLQLQKLPSIWPTVGRIQSLFGYRNHPIYGEKSFHAGTDISNVAGTSVLASADGQVIWTGNKGEYGQTIVIKHLPAVQTQYSHLEAIRVENGQWIKRGETIGTLGSSGLTTGPHLHYEVHVKGKPQDPLLFIFN